MIPKTRIGITGGIASGKSYICRKLEAAGHPVFHCDDEARRIMHDDPEVRAALCRLIGPEVYGADGRLCKPVVAAFLQRGAEQAEQVNRIVHPKVAEAFLAFCEKQQILTAASPPLLRERGSGGEAAAPITVDDLAALPRGQVVFMECALLFEAGFDRLVDLSVLVHAGRETQIRRLMARNQISRPEAEAWLSLQKGEDERIARADYILNNELEVPLVENEN